MPEILPEVLSSEVNSLRREIAELKGLFHSFSDNYVRRDLYDLRHQELETRISFMAAEIRSLRTLSWIKSTTALIIGAVSASLVLYALTGR